MSARAERMDKTQTEATSTSRFDRGLKIAVILMGVAVVATAVMLVYGLFQKPPAPRTMAELKIEEALALVKKKPSDALAHIDLGSAYLEVGKDQEAVDEFKTAVKLAPTNWVAHYCLANAYVVTDKKKEAIKEFETAIGIVPNNGALRYGLGELYMQLKDYKKARLVLEGAVLAEPTAADSRALLGKAYEMLGKKTEAIEQYKEALRFSPDLEEAKEGLSRLEKKEGK